MQSHACCCGFSFASSTSHIPSRSKVLASLILNHDSYLWNVDRGDSINWIPYKSTRRYFKNNLFFWLPGSSFSTLFLPSSATLSCAQVRSPALLEIMDPEYSMSAERTRLQEISLGMVVLGLIFSSM